MELVAEAGKCLQQFFERINWPQSFLYHVWYSCMSPSRQPDGRESSYQKIPSRRMGPNTPQNPDMSLQNGGKAFPAGTSSNPATLQVKEDGYAISFGREDAKKELSLCVVLVRFSIGGFVVVSHS